MTEREWRRSTDPWRMLVWLGDSGKTTRSRLGSLLGACCELIPPAAVQPRSRFVRGLRPPGPRAAPSFPWLEEPPDALTEAEHHLFNALDEVIRAARNGAKLAALVREIFGNPFRPVTFDPTWRSDTAGSLAKHIYEARDFSRMLILADALQDAGCDNADILNHCRDPQQTHVRGCWVVDLVLNKS